MEIERLMPARSPLQRVARCALLVCSVLLTSLSAAPARASGFATQRFGGEHGNVTTTNPTALYYNPAGIGFSQGIHVFVDGSLALRRVTWQHAAAPSDAPEVPGTEGASTGTAKLFNVFGAPMLGVSARFGDLAAGAGVFVPFGGRAQWSRNERFVDHPTYPLAGDGIQRWHSIRGALTFIYGSGGLAYRLGPLSLGAAVNVVAARVESLRARNPAGDTLPDIDSEGRADTEVSGVFGSFGVGAMVVVVPDRLWLGASYQAQPGLGPMKLSGTLVVTHDGARREDRVELHQAMPDIVRAGARYRPSKELELRLFGDVTRWSVMQTQCLALEGYPCVVTSTGADAGGGGGIFLNFRRRWRDTVGVRAGVSHWTSPELELFAGAGFETAATRDEYLDPELPDSRTLQGTLGARWEIVPKLFLAGSYSHLYYLPRDTTGKSLLSQAEIPTARPDGGGRYTQWVGIINANVEKEF